VKQNEKSVNLVSNSFNLQLDPNKSINCDRFFNKEGSMVVKIGTAWFSGDLCLCGFCKKSKDCTMAKELRPICNHNRNCYKSCCEFAEMEQATFKCPCGKE
jgi:hypothetical protein